MIWVIFLTLHAHQGEGCGPSYNGHGVGKGNFLKYLEFGLPYKTSSRFFTSPEEFLPSGDVWFDSGDVVSPREA